VLYYPTGAASYCDSRGVVDWRSLHAGNPVLEGEKWVASKWMRQRRFVSA
jgi:prolyl 4-hydroxylase